MQLYLDFPTILTGVVLLTGLITLVDGLFMRKHRKQRGDKEPWAVEYARSFFPVLLVVLIIRSFLIQAYRVPTGSLEPTIMPGDFVLVSQFEYGVRLPVLHTKLLKVGEPQHGDLVLFRYPPYPKRILFKRMIGLPGDRVVYRNKVLYVNGQKMPQQYLSMGYDVEPGRPPVLVYKYSENFFGVKHNIFVRPVGGQDENFSLTVPKGQYFAMGDNRDDSEDSRIWGFVPEDHLIGKAFRVLFGWDADNFWFRPGRFWGHEGFKQ